MLPILKITTFEVLSIGTVESNRCAIRQESRLPDDTGITKRAVVRPSYARTRCLHTVPGRLILKNND